MKCYKIGRQREKNGIEFSSAATHWNQKSCLFDTAKGFDIMFYAIFITFILNSTTFSLAVQLKMVS